MTRGIRVAVAAAVCGILAGSSVACGGGTPNTSGGGDAAAERTRLWGLLRSDTSNLPEGFSTRPRDGWVPPFRARDRDCQTLFDVAGGRPSGRGPTARVAVSYPGNGLGEVAGVSLASYAGEEARLHYGELTEALSGCRIARSPAVAGRSTSLRVSGLTLDAVEGDVQARRLRGRLNGYPYEMHMVFALAGRTVVSLVHAGIDHVDAERTGQIARFLIERAAA